MRFSTIFASVSIAGSAVGLTTPTGDLTSTAEDPRPEYVRIKDIKALGTGCPPGTSDVYVNPAGTQFDVTFSKYEIFTGPDSRASDARKNCKLTINLEYSAGYQFSVLNTDMEGFANLPSGVTAQCVNTFSFTSNAGEYVQCKLPINGPYSGGFNLESRADVSKWSTCGRSTEILNMNTYCNIRPTKLESIIAVDQVTGKLSAKFKVDWRKCTE